MFASKDALFAKSSGSYQISRSLRFRSSASAYLNRTPASASNRKTWTWNGWIKLGAIPGSIQKIFTAGSAGTAHTGIQLNASNQLEIFDYASGYVFQLVSTQVFRDPSSWYMVTVVVDSTQATSTNRVKAYVNGAQITSFGTATYPATQNANFEVNNNSIHAICKSSISAESYYFDGYLSEVNFIDGQALTPSSFGAFDTNGVWQPARYTGSYGTNGFYLNFSDNSGATATTIGKDSSGNSNNWTPNNISVTSGTTYDSMIDSPTNYADGGNGRGNYAVLNPLHNQSSTYLTNGNLNFSGTPTSTYTPATIVLPTSGKYAFIYYCTNASASKRDAIGVVDLSSSVGRLSTVTNSVAYLSFNGQVLLGPSETLLATYSTWTNGDYAMCAIDCATGKVWFGLNGVWQGSPSAGTGNAATLTNNGNLAFAVSNLSTTTSYSVSGSVDFGQQGYTPPSGFSALNTQNLPTPTIAAGNKYFDATTYQGTGSSQNITNSGSFQPDLVWIKGRSTSAQDHTLVDAVRGVYKRIRSNTTGAEVTETNFNVTAFNANGFSVADDTAGSYNVNGSVGGTYSGAAQYIGWQWNAGGSTVTNTSGSITSQVRANPTAGFSVVTYTGTGANATFGHGLGVTPGLVIIKNRSAATDWFVWHSSIAGYYLLLNSTSAQIVQGSVYPGNPWSAGVNIGTSNITNGNGNNHVAYCFAPVAGYSAFGSYTGNGSTDGPFVYTGFRPKFFLLKRTDAAGYDWFVQDTSVNTYNPTTNYLYPNQSAAEQTNSAIDFLSNGVKIRLSDAYHNASGGTYIYAAFAENPLKFARAR